MKTPRSKSLKRTRNALLSPDSTTPAAAPTANSPHHNPLKDFFTRGREFFRGIRRARSQELENHAPSTTRDSAILTVPDHSRMGTVNSERAFIVVQEGSGSTSRQDIVVQVTPPPERGDAGGFTDSSLQSIDYFDATDLQPFTTFNKIVRELANVHPHAKAALNGLSWASQTIVKQESRNTSVHKLLRKLKEVYEFMIKTEEFGKILLMPNGLGSLSEQVVECAKFLAKLSIFTRLWDQVGKDAFVETDATIQKYTDSLDWLVAVLRVSPPHDAASNVYHVLQDLGNHLYFNTIPWATDAVLDATKTCLEGTRSEILKELIDWAYSEDDVKRVYWLSGDEGTGKSAIVHTVARWLKESGRLGSFFRFDLTWQGDHHPGKLFTTIARDLASFDPGLSNALADVIYTDPSFLTTTDILLQWRRLVLEPLQKSSPYLGPVFLVIDALDECRPDSSRQLILHILASEVTQLPPNVRILVTSRPTSDIHFALQDKPYACTASLDDIPREYVERDIQLYISHRLNALFRDEQYGLLTTRADGLFEWARIACDFVSSLDQLEGGSTSDDLLQRVLSSSDAGLQSPLDQIYTLILKIAIRDSRQARYQFSSVMRQVLWTLEPLPVSSLNEMRHFFSAAQDHFDVEPILKSIAPLVTGIANSISSVRIAHASFHDFLTDRERSGEFYIDLNGVHQELARSSLASMKLGLRFNLCGLESSHLRNSDIPDLAQRIKERITPHLSYSCRFWISHVHDARFEIHMANELCSFLKSEQLLFWLEVLGLLGQVDKVHAMPGAVSKLLSGRDEYAGTLTIIHDARKLVEIFGNAITQSVPHLYLSALPFSPEQSVLAKLFTSKVRRVPRIITGHDTHWPTSQLSLTGHADWVRSVAISRDGKWVVSSSDDSTIRIWDVETGMEICDPLEHSGFVMSVTFSPDSRSIISASSDTTIRVWDVQTGLQVGSPLQGHTGAVNSVVFCPDGTWFASGSSDNTIRIWDIKTHTQVAILEGHPKPINSIAVSLNAERIASGSTDGTIRVWNTTTWSQVGDTINGHASPTNTVAFSPDGKLVASGSDDSTIRLWNFRTGSLVGTLEGHIDNVTSVAFSVDSRYIVSGSSDRTVRVWDARTHSQIGNALSGHTGKVSSVAVSHDGRVVVSASWDGSVRTWDTRLSPVLGRQTSPVFSVALSPATKQVISGSFDGVLKVYDAATGVQAGDKSLKGHSSTVASIAISLDGTKIASGSSDKTVRIWDMEARSPVGGPLRGHTSQVNAVAFSPDGKWVVSGSDDDTIRVWDMTTSQTSTILQEHKDAINAIVFSLDGKRLVSGSADKTIRVWDATTWLAVGMPLTGHTQPVRSVALSPDGAQIASGSSDNTIRLWDTQTGSLVHVLEGHTGTVRSVVFSLDGRCIVSGSDDGIVRVWDVKTGSQLGGPLIGHTSSVRSVVLDAEWIVSGSEDGTIRVWDIKTVLRRTDPLDHHAISTLPASGSTHKGKGKADVNDVQEHVRFSPSFHHALHEPPRVDGVAHETDYIRVRPDGSVEAGARRQLLFWVPTHWRDTLWSYPSDTVMVIPRGMELDLSEMVHGPSWQECWVE